MRLHTDDEIYAVDAVWLGPRGNTLPWRARYAAYGVALLAFLVLLGIERRVGLHIGLWVVIYDVLGAVAITRAVMRYVDHERPLRSAAATFWHEVHAPRTPPVGQSVTVAPAFRVSDDVPRTPHRFRLPRSTSPHSTSRKDRAHAPARTHRAGAHQAPGVPAGRSLADQLRAVLDDA